MNLFPKSWYEYIIVVEPDAIYCSHLAICLLGELLTFEVNPVLTSYKSLQEIVNHLIPDIKHSLKLLEKLELIEIRYPSKPMELLEGAIAIRLNLPKIERLNNGFPTQTQTHRTSIPRSGIVYVIQSGETSLYKIGRTTNLERRLKQLQTMNSHNLSIWKVIYCQDAIAIETSLHHKFKSFRKQGEWFQLNEICLQEIERIAKTLTDFANFV
jgi:predicted GIY-YIG superfamily endonuclease